MNENRYAPPNAPVADIDQAASLERPKVVKIGAWMMWSEVVFGVPGVVFAMLNLPAKLATGVAHVTVIVGLVVVLGFIALGAWFTWMAYQGRNWARIVQLVFMILGLLSGWWTLKASFAKSTYDGVVSVIQYVLNTAGVVLLFVPSANAWYRAMRERRY
jgi:hypothetical protein